MNDRATLSAIDYAVFFAYIAFTPAAPLCGRALVLSAFRRRGYN
jgi:hypothetical protein